MNRWVSSLFLVAVLISGCRSAPTTHYYVLAPSAAGSSVVSEREAEGLTVGVEPFTVDPPYDTDRLVYRFGTDSVEVGFYAYHRWASPPGDLVAVAMAEGLRGTRGIAKIEPASSSEEYAARLRGRVVHLEEIDIPGQQQARLRIEMRLVDEEGRLLWADDISASASGQNETVGDIVRQLYAAFEQVLMQTRASLEAAELHIR